MAKNQCLKRFEKRNIDTVRFAVISDVHIQDTAYTLDMALEAFDEIGGCNALLMLGDIVYQDGFEPEGEKFDIVMNKLKENIGNIPLVYTIGNHEFPILTFRENIAKSISLFEKKTGQTVKYHTVISGYHFITDISVTEPDIEWIEGIIEEAVKEDKNKPVFLMRHDGYRNMLLHTKESEREWSLKLQSILRRYTQVVALIGHVHITAHSPDVVAQDGFTVVQVPCLGEIGYIQGDGFFAEFFIPGSHQAMMIEIEDNTVYIYKLNLEDKEYIGEPFIINIPGLVNGTSEYQYTDKRKTNSNTPYFDGTAAIEVSNIDKNSVRICFPKAYNKPMNEFTQDGFVIAYRVKIFEEDTKDCIFSEIVVSDFYKVNSMEKISDKFYKRIRGLRAFKKYEIEISPISPFRKEGLPIKTSFAIQSK